MVNHSPTDRPGQQTNVIGEVGPSRFIVKALNGPARAYEHMPDEPGEAARRSSDLPMLLRDYSLVLVGRGVCVAYWKKERIPGGGQHEVLQLIGVDALQFSIDGDVSDVAAWTEIEPGRFMPRRVRGSFQGRALG